MTETKDSSTAAEGSSCARRALVVAAVFSTVVAAGLIVIFAPEILLLLFAATIFAAFLGGVSRTIAQRTRLPYGAALTIVAVGLLALAIGTVAYLAPQIGRQAVELTTELTAAGQDLYARLRNNSVVEHLPSGAQEPGSQVLEHFNAFKAIGGIFSTAAGAVTGLVVILFVGFYIALNPSLYERGVVALVPPPHRARAQEVLQKVGRTLWWWTLGRLTSMAIIGVLVTVGLWLFGIPLPVALGLLAALLTFIPNVGPFLALIPPVLLALREGPMLALGVVGFYLAVQAVESYVITPVIEQRAVALPPAITISSQLLLGFFTGILGLALATPLAAVVMVLTQELYIKDVLEARAPTSGGHASRRHTR